MLVCYNSDDLKLISGNAVFHEGNTKASKADSGGSLLTRLAALQILGTLVDLSASASHQTPFPASRNVHSLVGLVWLLEG